MKRLVIGISGASGVMYGVQALRILAKAGIETHLVMTKAAKVTLAYETGMKVAEVEALAATVHGSENIGAAIASGSFKTMGMLVAPCSIRTLSEIAHGVTAGLLTRAADVTLKERRPLVLLVRESPLHVGHIRSMLAVSEMGAIVAPPVPAFYARPETLEDMVEYTVIRALDLFGLDLGHSRRWPPLEKP